MAAAEVLVHVDPVEHVAQHLGDEDALELVRGLAELGADRRVHLAFRAFGIDQIGPHRRPEARLRTVLGALGGRGQARGRKAGKRKRRIHQITSISACRAPAALID
ncbi:hypothetical protein D3C71_1968500 [compost metagenome]